jgi:hypothetical protein
LRLQALRWRSVALGRGHALVFERDARGWSWCEAQDGNGNGVRSAEIVDGTDPVLSGPTRPGQGLDGVGFGFPPRGPWPAPPPGTDSILEPDDPVRFGRSDMVACAASGACSSGTLHLTDGKIGWVAVVLFGPTARVRVWRFDRASGRWR